MIRAPTTTAFRVAGVSKSKRSTQGDRINQIPRSHVVQPVHCFGNEKFAACMLPSISMGNPSRQIVMLEYFRPSDTPPDHWGECRSATNYVCLWRLADNPATPPFVRFWGNSGQWSAVALNGSVANDPKRRCECKESDASWRKHRLRAARA